MNRDHRRFLTLPYLVYVAYVVWEVGVEGLHVCICA